MKKDLKIVFICGSLENGKDGVGDYTLRLSSELAKTNSVYIIAIYDKFLVEKTVSSTIINDISIVRLSSNITQSERKKRLEEHINQIKPQYISLQFVPFAFHRRGLPIFLINQLSRIKNVRWHIMFHELWVGMDVHASRKLKLWGKLQFYIIRNLIGKLCPCLIHSSNPLYVYHIMRMTKSCTIKELPLFGNIKRTSFNGNSPSLVKSKLNIVLFAGIHHGAPIREFLKWIVEETLSKKTIIKFTFIGRNGSFIREWTRELEQQEISYQILGVQTDEMISKVLANANLGISTTPYFLSGKSGSVAAMLEHQLPVLCVARKWIPEINTKHKFIEQTNVRQWSPKLRIETFLGEKNSYNSLEKISEQFIKDLTK